MSNVIKKLAGQTALYGLSSMLGRAANFLLVPIYTALLEPTAFGVITELYAYMAFLNVVYTYGLETGYFRFSKQDSLGEDASFSLTLTNIIVTTITFSVVLWGFQHSILHVLQYPHKTLYVTLCALILATDALASLPFARLRKKEKALHFASIKLMSIFLNIGLNVLFLSTYRDSTSWLQPFYSTLTVFGEIDNVVLILLANFISNFAVFPFLLNMFKGYEFKKHYLFNATLMAYCIPLFWMGLAGMVNEVIDRILLKYLLPTNFYPGQTTAYAVGVYGACYKLSMFMTLAVQSFRYAADPFFFNKSTDKNAPALFAKVMNWFVITCLVLFLVVSIYISYFGLLLRSASYREGLYIVPVLLLANLFLGVYYNLSMWYKLTDNTRFGTYFSFWGAALTIVGNVILIPYLGYWGSAITTLICYFSMALLSWYFGQKYYPIPYPIIKIASYIFLCIGLVYAHSFINIKMTLSLDLMYKFLYISLFGAVVYVTEFRLSKK